MMTGEFEFDSLFHSSDGNFLVYPLMSYWMFIIFVAVMTILIMNLLVRATWRSC